MWYLIGVVLSFILGVFFIALIHNEKLIEKYEWIENCYNMFNDMPDTVCMTLLLAILVWPVTITIIFLISIGYCLFKIFSKLINYFIENNIIKL